MVSGRFLSSIFYNYIFSDYSMLYYWLTYSNTIGFKYFHNDSIAQLTGAVEYTDCFSAER